MIHDYTKDQLKDLESYVNREIMDSPKEITWWSDLKYKDAELFLEPLDYDIKLLKKLYTINLKKRRPLYLIKKKLGLKSYVSFPESKINKCFEIYRTLLKDLRELPLMIHTEERVVSRAVIKWRLMNGV